MARQALIPGVGYINETGTRQAMVPGVGYVNETVATGATYTLTAATGTFTVTGNDAGLYAGRKLTAQTGTFSVTGNAAGLYVGRKLIAETGTFSVTGNDASLKAGRKLTAETGTFVVTGNDANLVYTPISGPTYTLTAETGSFTVTGNDAGLYAGRRLNAETGVFVVTGYDVNFIVGGGTFNENQNIHIDSIGGMVLQLGTTTVPTWDTLGRPDNPTRGMVGVNTETQDIEIYNGTGWLYYKIAGKENYTTSSTNYSLTATDYLIECTATMTATLPTAVGIEGKVYSIKNSGSGLVTLATTSSQTIDGSTSVLLNQYDGIKVMSNGSNWIIT